MQYKSSQERKPSWWRDVELFNPPPGKQTQDKVRGKHVRPVEHASLGTPSNRTPTLLRVVGSHKQTTRFCIFGTEQVTQSGSSKTDFHNPSQAWQAFGWTFATFKLVALNVFLLPLTTHIITTATLILINSTTQYIHILSSPMVLPSSPSLAPLFRRSQVWCVAFPFAQIHSDPPNLRIFLHNFSRFSDLVRLGFQICPTCTADMRQRGLKRLNSLTISLHCAGSSGALVMM